MLLGRALTLALFGFLPCWTLLAQPPAKPQGTTLSAEQRLAREILKELIETNPTDSSGDVTRAAEAMAARLRAAGFPAGDVQVLGPRPRKGNLVARLRGTGTGNRDLVLALTADEEGGPANGVAWLLQDHRLSSPPS